MQITDVRVRKVAKEGKMKAVVSITIADEFVVHDIKVIEGEKGLFIAMPSRKPVVLHGLEDGVDGLLAEVLVRANPFSSSQSHSKYSPALKLVTYNSFGISICAN